MMGGNLFKDARRHELDEYTKKLERANTLLSSLNIKGEEVRYLTSKTDFGDLDMITDRSTLTIERLSDIAESYDYTINGKHVSIERFFENKTIEHVDLFSFNLDGLQVDLIAIEPDSYDFALYYHAFNDLGGLLGTTVKALGFRLGREGLYKNYLPVPGRAPYRLYITKDYREFARLFNVDLSIYEEGNEIKDHRHMYEYLKSWEYFRFFDMRPELMNATRRNRAAKRKTFNAINNLSKLYNDEDSPRNNDDVVTEIRLRMDSSISDYVGRQIKDFDELSRQEDKKVRSYTKERVVRVLGYEPGNVQELMQRVSMEFGGGEKTREATVQMDDHQFKKLIEYHMR